MARRGANLSERFTSFLREEHRAMRDIIFELIGAFEVQDLNRIRASLANLIEVTGPHFRYEEEAVFPAVASVFGDDYVDRVLRDHDSAVGLAIRLDNIAQQSEVSPDEGRRMATLIRNKLLPHVSDCEGLSIMVEQLPDVTLLRILKARERALAEGLDLFAWATRVRKRPALLD